jgi:sulfate permease, SulP family
MKLRFRFRPRVFDLFKNYQRASFLADLSAGVTVGLVALPLAMAFAIASGLRPEMGIFTAIVAGFLISALGGSAVQIGGPAGAFIVIVFGIVTQYGVANLLLATMLAGVLLFVMGLLGLGHAIRLIPVSIVLGFTNGIAVLIGLSQVKDFFGLKVSEIPANFFEKIAVLSQSAALWNGKTLFISVTSLLIVGFWPKVSAEHSGLSKSLSFLSKFPSTLVALCFGALLVSFLGWNVETIGTRFGEIPQTLPAFALPEFRWATVQHLFAPTLTIALLGAIESLLCARVADTMIRDRHDPNQELMAQGIANFVAPLFGGYCATGTIARTVTNVRAGGTTPISGMVHAFTLLLIILVAAPLAKNIPLASLAAILVVVAYNMGDWREFLRLKQFSLNYRLIFLSTFLLTIMIDLTVAVEVGLALACLLFITRVRALTRIEKLDDTELERQGMATGNIEAHRIVGSLFFAAVGKLEYLLDPKRQAQPFLILEASQMLNLDTTGLEALENLHTRLVHQRSQLILSGLQEQPRSLLRRSGFAARLGEENIVTDLAAALALALAKGPHPPKETNEKTGQP